MKGSKPNVYLTHQKVLSKLISLCKKIVFGVSVWLSNQFLFFFYIVLADNLNSDSVASLDDFSFSTKTTCLLSLLFGELQRQWRKGLFCDTVHKVLFTVSSFIELVYKTWLCSYTCKNNWKELDTSTRLMSPHLARLLQLTNALVNSCQAHMWNKYTLMCKH